MSTSSIRLRAGEWIESSPVQHFIVGLILMNAVILGLETSDEVMNSAFGKWMILADQLILAVVDVLEGEKETEIVRMLLRLRDSLTRQESGVQLTPQAEAARAEVINLVNNFFFEKLTGMPAIKEYMEGKRASAQ